MGEPPSEDEKEVKSLDNEELALLEAGVPETTTRPADEVLTLEVESLPRRAAGSWGKDPLSGRPLKLTAEPALASTKVEVQSGATKLPTIQREPGGKRSSRTRRLGRNESKRWRTTARERERNGKRIGVLLKKDTKDARQINHALLFSVPRRARCRSATPDSRHSIRGEGGGPGIARVIPVNLPTNHGMVGAPAICRERNGILRLPPYPFFAASLAKGLSQSGFDCQKAGYNCQEKSRKKRKKFSKVVKCTCGGVSEPEALAREMPPSLTLRARTGFGLAVLKETIWKNCLARVLRSFSNTPRIVPGKGKSMLYRAALLVS
jgi:hypothetical protein